MSDFLDKIRDFPADFETADFDVKAYINSKFSGDFSLQTEEELDSLIAEVQAEAKKTAEYISQQVQSESLQTDLAEKELKIAQETIKDLLAEAEMIKGVSQNADAAVEKVVAEIRELDATKSRLTQTITALKRLSMFVTGLDKLREVCESRDYLQCANMILALQNLAENFQAFPSNANIQALFRVYEDILEKLKYQVSEDYRGIAEGRLDVNDGSALVDALNESPKYAGLREELMNHFCQSLLHEYKRCFRPGSPDSDLDHLDRRFAWLRRTLSQQSSVLTLYFQRDWQMPLVITQQFAKVTVHHLQDHLAARSYQSDPKKLFRALQKTVDFEGVMSQKYGSAAVLGSISQVFDPYLGCWLDSEEQLLADQVREFEGEPDKIVGQADDPNSHEPRYIFESAITLFTVIKACLTRCTALTQIVAQLPAMFGRIVGQYLQLLGQRIKFSRILETPELRLCCAALGTAEYVDATLPELQFSLEQVLKDQSTLMFEGEGIQCGNLIQQGYRELLTSGNLQVQQCWEKMFRQSWDFQSGGLKKVSPFVNDVHDFLTANLRQIYLNLNTLHYLFFLDQFQAAFAESLSRAVESLAKVSPAGARQLLVDLESLKTSMIEVPLVVKSAATDLEKLPESYVHKVIDAFTSLEATIKVWATPRINEDQGPSK